MDRIDTVRLAAFSNLGADAGAPAERLDLVFIENFVGHTVIGIDSSELHVPQPVRVNLTIGVPAIRACTTDRIEDTVNYAAVRDALLALFESHRLRLLEALAETIAQMLIADFGAHWVRVSLAKPAKFDDVAAVGVQIERRRGDASVAQVGLARYASLGEGLVPD
ncbi:dihydroneopterin aldolase [Paraburkholderia sp. MMS20-SJTR3]|uniref:dihydroneopterin aldolase n=1 Tax=Paraburkholderia sejongensis TaxID=2886946 RepID=A0ABS8K1S0_9BURK|nr:dihydroneopterin aldolase [Paraburkholderia sp. MMS20-SJTR3]MCC8396100.1 dihydroneopterin aldolase [Paraburkholderia sp. MMS20-SJTR3]